MRNNNGYTERDFTFVICAYKQCRYLETCVLSLLNQTTKAEQILISTSTPNEHITGLAEKYGLQVRINRDGGQVKDYNFALNQAETKLVMLMHQDEILAETFLEKVLKALNASYEPIIAFTNYKEMHHDTVDIKDSALVKIKRIMLLPLRFLGGNRGHWKRGIQLLGNPITHPTVVCVKDRLPDKPFDERYKADMDWDLFERLSRQKGSFVYVPDILLYHRMNDQNQTAQLLKTTNDRYSEDLEILSRFWPRFIARIIMRFYKKSANYY